MNALGYSEPLEPFVRIVGAQLFGLYIASAGLTEEEAQLYHETTTTIDRQETEDQSVITVKLITEKSSGRILGGQVSSETNILPIIDTLATAIKGHLTDRDLTLQDYLYYAMDQTMTSALHETAFLSYRKRLKEAGMDAS